MQLKHLEPCLMPALIYGREAWGYIKKEGMKEIGRIQGRAFKIIFRQPVSTIETLY